MTDRKLRFGIPIGSLNRAEPNRGDTKLLLETAGWKFKDGSYNHRAEKAIPLLATGDDSVTFYAMKPRAFPYLLSEFKIDAAICGRDIVAEWYSGLMLGEAEKVSHCSRIMKFIKWILNRSEQAKTPREQLEDLLKEDGFCFEKGGSLLGPNLVCDLGYGKVDLVFATPQETYLDYKSVKESGTDEVRGLLEFLVKKNQQIIRHAPLTSDDIRRPKLSLATPYLNIAFRALSEYFPLNELYFPNAATSFRSANKNVRIAEIRSKTEICSAFHDLILECKSSGESIRNCGLVEVGKPLLSSTAGLYSVPHHPLLYPTRIPFIAFYDDEQIEEEMYLEEKIGEIKSKLQSAARELGWLDRV